MAEVPNKMIQGAITVLTIILITLCTVANGRTIYVDADATNISDGSSWANAYWCLQDALSNAQAGDEIRVAYGTYKPDRRVTITRSRRQITASGDRAAAFHLINGVTLRGGYAGFGEPDPDARDVLLYETILSGDLNGNDGPNFINNSDNSYHVVNGSRTNPTDVLDGFTITGGNANRPPRDIHGGGIYADDVGNLTVVNCTLIGNSAREDGGGIYCIKSAPTIENSTIAGNVAFHYGGGIHCDASLQISNSVIAGNSAMYGGAIFCFGSSPTVTNCTIVDNFASGYGGGGIYCGNASPIVVNTILWNNSPDEIYLKHSSVNVAYSDVQGGWSGPGNINTDPLFVDADGADGVIGTEDDDLRLLPGSPCIDAGDNSVIPPSVATDLDGNPRIINDTVDMGTYEADVAPTQNVYYVDVVNGNNDNDGLMPETAFATIQHGIDAAADGEVVLVYPGLYQEEINFLGKTLTVQGVAVSPAGVPVLHNPGDFAVSFYYGEGPGSILKNFIIRDSFMGVFIADSSPTISNLTIVGNKYGIEAYADSEPDISNTILWDNTDGDLFGCRARYSCVERGGEGNITADPLFVDTDNDDYHLRSERGRYWPEYDIWVLDKVTSPCVDGGDPDTDTLNEPIPHGGRINIGAYGGTMEASLSPLYMPTKYSGGSGTAEDPYQISTADDLILLGESPEDYDKHFILTADINLDPALSGRKVFDKAIIAPDRIPDMYGPFDGIPFAGTFDGNDHTISNLTITGESYLGLFGQLGPEARISNIGLEAVDIDGIGISIGGLMGYNNGSITKSYSTGTVSGAYGVGGLASYSDGCITACYSTGTVSGSTDVGGLVGFNAGIINSSHCTETVTGDESVGGLVGYNYSVKLGDGIITTSYSTGTVFGRRSCIGGLVGRNQGNITTSYSSSAVSGTSILGGLVGWNARGGSITSSFWDVETSGRISSDGGIGKTTDAMQTAATFLEVGWDFVGETANGTDDIWWILEGQDYPRLWWEVMYEPPPEPEPEPEPEWVVIELTEATFDEIVLLSDLPVLVDFWAPWCGPCLMMAPVIEEIAGEFAGRLKVCKLNTDYSPSINERYDITAIPTIILFKDGQIQKIWIGVTSKEDITAEFNFSESGTDDIQAMSVRASNPYPADGAGDVERDVTLRWTPGLNAISHDVYFGINRDDVVNADTSDTTGTYRGRNPNANYIPPDSLIYSGTYYWRIDEVNEVNPNSPWKGNVWSLTTANFIVVDDFESYDAYYQIWWTWRDGLGYATESWPEYGTGSVVGDESTTSYTEETIVHGGKQSMPYRYDNDKLGFAKYSHAERFLSYPRDWTEEGVEELSLWFYGEPTNDSEPMYVAISNRFGAPVAVYHNDPNAAGIEAWTEWIIPLQKFADQGINLTDVDRIAIGLGIQGNRTIPGGRGKMYFDDIRLYRPRSTASHDLEVNVP